MAHLLEVSDLNTSFATHAGEVQAVRGVSFHVDEGEAVALVGESGCGKSATAMSIIGLIPSPPGRIRSGEVRFRGRDLLSLSAREMERVRGKEIAMIFQDPMTSLNPVLSIGLQMTEGLRWHQGMTRPEARRRAVEMLRLVGIPNPEERMEQYSHQLSGGMRQRVLIAMALACEPRLLLADEPTTALDVTIQAQIMELLRGLRRRLGTAVVLITHDLGVVAGFADRVIVMYAGKVVEEGPVRQIYRSPRHPYTWGLLRSVPRLDAPRKRRLQPIGGSPPDLASPPPGCPFFPRCEHAMRICEREMPALAAAGAGHRVACWLTHPSAPRVIPPDLRGERSA